MCKIIEFKPRQSNGYRNLVALFEMCDNVESCNFYLETVEPGTYLYTPEMGQEKPEECEMVAGLCYYGNHYWIRTPLELKGRGIRKDEPTRDGLNNYTVTKLAYSKLEKQYKIAYESNLD